MRSILATVWQIFQIINKYKKAYEANLEPTFSIWKQVLSIVLIKGMIFVGANKPAQDLL